MFDAFTSLMGPAMVERLVLAINHVLGSEPVATARLAPHRGKIVVVLPQDWPRPLPAPPSLAFRITPAGMLEWCGLDAPASNELTLRVDASNPAALALGAVLGKQPKTEIDGDAALATDINWLIQNLRWDAAADMERLFGPVVAQQLAGIGRTLAAWLRAALDAGAGLGQQIRARRP